MTHDKLHISAVTRHVEVKGVMQQFVTNRIVWNELQHEVFTDRVNTNFLLQNHPLIELITSRVNNCIYLKLFNQFYSVHLLICTNKLMFDTYSMQLTDIQQWIEFPFPYFWPFTGKGGGGGMVLFTV
jgi:hypothetical protein